MAMAAVFIVIVVVINMIVGAIPSKYSQLDVSSSKLYAIGDETKKVLKALDKDVTIYQIAASGSEDDTISNLLSRYKDESKHIKVEVKDPVVNPKFASEYTTNDVASNSLMVVCGDRNKVINYNDMYSSSVDYNTWQQTTTGFDEEKERNHKCDRLCDIRKMSDDVYLYPDTEKKIWIPALKKISRKQTLISRS